MLNFKKTSFHKLLLSTCVVLTYGIYSIVNNTLLVATNNSRQEIHIDKQKINIPVYQDRNGNYKIKVSDLNDTTYDTNKDGTAEIFEFENCSVDKDGDGYVTDQILNPNAKSGGIPTITMNYTLKDKELKGYQIKHNYINYLNKMKYTVTEPEEVLTDSNNDKIKDATDIDLEKYKKSEFQGKSYGYENYKISYDSTKKLFVVDINYSIGKGTTQNIDNMSSTVVNTGSYNNVCIVFAMVCNLLVLIILPKLIKLNKK